MTSPRVLVERFYHVVWNRADDAAARDLLDPAFRFRGSLGPEKIGADGFIDYMRSVHAALANYECVIEDLIEGSDRAAARMRFRGTHRGPLLGFPPTGREVSWAGAAFFTTASDRITALWVLGDLDALKAQLAP